MQERILKYSVFRHGIMHGMVTNFDNEVVASKAWCMLFAVCDWVDAIEADKGEARNRRTKKADIYSLLDRYFDSKKKNLENKAYCSVDAAFR